MTYELRWGRSRSMLRLAVIGLLVGIIACSAAIADAGSGRGIMLDVRDARLTDVVQLLIQQSGASVSVNPEVADKRVTAVIYDKPLELVLERVVKDTAGVDYWKTDDGTYIIGGKRPQPAVEPIIPEPIPQPVYVEKDVQPVRTEIIKLVNSDPRELLIAMGIIDPPYDPNATFLGMKKGGRLGILDEDRAGTGIRFRRSEPAGTNYDTAPPAIDPNTLPFDAGRAANLQDGAGQTSRGYGGPLVPPGGAAGTAGGRTPTAPGGGTGSTSGTGSGTLLPEGVVLVQPFPFDNSLIVRGTDEGIAEFKDLVHLLDVAPKQIQIKAEFIEVSTSDVKRFGIDWSLERLNEEIRTNFNPGGNVIVGLTTGNLAASLRTELTNTSGQVINSPIISTVNNEQATIAISSYFPYWTSRAITTGTGIVQTEQELGMITVYTALSVLPRVNGDGTITLIMEPQVQDMGQMHKAPDGSSEVPETKEQSLACKRRVMNGETIVVGGFVRKNSSTSISQVPILGSLPLIGPLFRSKSTATDDRELLIFVTPTIIGERAAGSSIGVSTYP